MDWVKGQPPQDDREYEVRQRATTFGGHPYTVQDAPRASWVDGQLCRRSQFHGGLVPLLMMNEWRLAAG